MKILAIGDIHGNSIWERIVAAHPEVDHIVFIGDYFDSFWIEPAEQLTNFNKILQLKASRPDEVTLLIGNHDYHYLTYVQSQFSGYEAFTQFSLRNKIDDLLKSRNLEVGFYGNGKLFTHAGITQTWADKWGIDATPAQLPDQLYELLYHQPRAFDFHPLQSSFRYDPSGDDVWQGPLWVRPKSLHLDAYCDSQIFGHTEVLKHKGIQPNSVGFSIDALSLSTYLFVDQKEVTVMQIS